MSLATLGMISLRCRSAMRTKFSQRSELTPRSTLPRWLTEASASRHILERTRFLMCLMDRFLVFRGMTRCVPQSTIPRRRGRNVHLGTWGHQKSRYNVAANYYAIQRLRRHIGNASSSSSVGAYRMLQYIYIYIHIYIYIWATPPPRSISKVYMYVLQQPGLEPWT